MLHGANHWSETGRAGPSQTPSAAIGATLSSCGTSVPGREGPLRFSERYSRRQWLSDTRSIQVVLFQLRVTI